MKIKKRQNKDALPVDSYKHLGIDQLVVYSVKRIIDNSEECTFERLVYECFRFFPNKFGFLRYSNWPDAARINKAWLRCRTDKGWLAGTVKEGFRITPSGEEIARITEIELKKKNSIKKIFPSPKSRERYEAIISYIKNSHEYQKYIGVEKYEISQAELKSFLGGTLETPKRILRHNLNSYMNAADFYNEQLVILFLKLCKKNLEKLGG